MQSENDCVIPGTIFSYFNSTRVKLLFFCCKIITRKLTDVCALILLAGGRQQKRRSSPIPGKMFETWNAKASVRKPVCGNDGDEHHDGGVNQFGIFCQPVGQVYVKIFFGGVGIFAGNQRKRAVEPEEEQNKSFQQHQPIPDPQPDVNLVTYDGIQHVKNHHIEKKPHQCVQQFNEYQLGFFLHKVTLNFFCCFWRPRQQYSCLSSLVIIMHIHLNVNKAILLESLHSSWQNHHFRHCAEHPAFLLARMPTEAELLFWVAYFQLPSLFFEN